MSSVAKFKWDGMEEYERKLSRLGERSGAVVRKAVYAAAGLVAAEISAGISGLRITPEKRALANFKQGKPGYITPEQKAGLQASLGIARFRNENGFINTKIGFDGYNSIETEKYPHGQPNAMIARSCERGTTGMIAQPFVNKAVSRASKKAEAVMEQVLDEEISKIMD